MGQSKTARKRLAAKERRARAVELRKLGLTYQQIGDQLGVTPGGAHKMVVAALRKLNEKTLESAADLRRLETERLDQLLVAIASKARQGHLGAVDRVLKIMQRRARLWGLDLPVQIHADAEHEVAIREPRKPVEEMTDEELLNSIFQDSAYSNESDRPFRLKVTGDRSVATLSFSSVEGVHFRDV